LRNQFDPEAVKTELKRLNRHLAKIRNEQSIRKDRKRQRDVTLAHDDEMFPEAHNRQNTSVVADILIATPVSDDGTQTTAHRVDAAENSNATLVSDDGEQVTPHKKKRRRFKRRFLQPQPRRIRSRKRKSNNENGSEEPDKWNDVIKNITGEGISEIEKIFFSKGQKFCPVERDPPILRMQRELLKFYRNLRLKWVFKDETDKRSDLEKKFYLKSDWEPQKPAKKLKT
jgi:hypothetical protein